MKRVLLFVFIVPLGGRGAGFYELGDEIRSSARTEVKIEGDFRLRGELLYNLDLDRGLTPSGEPLFAVPLGDPVAQTLTHADMRLRTDLQMVVPQASLAIKARFDLLDNLALGSLPDGPPAATFSQRPPDEAIRLKRAWAEVLLPFGVLLAGRQGSHWGLGMLSHGGDCADCESGDAADRIALVTAIAGHLWALAYDFSATGPWAERRFSGRAIDLDPADDLRTLTFAVMRWHSPMSLARRLEAGRNTLDYGLSLLWRWQERDVPAWYLSLARPAELGGAQVVGRNLQLLGADIWLRWMGPGGRVEAEGALLWGRIGQASLVPGLELKEGLEMLQWGAALESELRLGQRLLVGLDAGVASGDPAPGFGARPLPNQLPAQPGDLDGPQADYPRDVRVDNFRFHPDYHIDRILFREIIGTVTDAVYVKPRLRVLLLEVGRGKLEAGLAAISSFALRAGSAPGGSRPLGVELDPTLEYRDGAGFSATLEYAWLFPLSGLDNPQAGLSARSAQLLRFRLNFNF
jgi:uncharacterized protein (TIGR04551 family)